MMEKVVLPEQRTRLTDEEVIARCPWEMCIRDSFLGIGIRKSQTARLVFTSKVGSGCTATVVDLGDVYKRQQEALTKSGLAPTNYETIVDGVKPVKLLSLIHI